MASEIEQQAERVLAEVPGWLWNGNSLPVPVDHIADSCFGLHVRDVDDLSAAPGVPALGHGGGAVRPAAAVARGDLGQRR